MLFGYQWDHTNWKRYFCSTLTGNPSSGDTIGAQLTLNILVLPLGNGHPNTFMTTPPYHTTSIQGLQKAPNKCQYFTTTISWCNDNGDKNNPAQSATKTTTGSASCSTYIIIIYDYHTYQYFDCTQQFTRNTNSQQISLRFLSFFLCCLGSMDCNIWQSTYQY